MKYLCIVLIVIITSSCMIKKQRFDHISLGDGLGLKLTKSWVGKEVSTLIETNDISKVILLRTITSAPDEIDVGHIINSIRNSTKFELRDELYFSENIIWQAVLLTHDGSYFYYQSDLEWIHIGSADGGGFFRMRGEHF